MHPLTMLAFHHKVAAAIGPGVLQRLARVAVSGAGSGAGVGAGIGAAAGAAQGLANSEEGGRTTAALNGALQGGILGGAAGATVGGLGRGVRDAKLLYADKSTPGAIATHLGSGVRRFGGRFRHGITGHGDAGALGMPSSTESARRIDLLKRRADADIAFNPAAREKVTKGLATETESLTSAGVAGDKAIKAGVTNLPGVVRGLATNPRETGRGLYHAMAGGGGAPLALGMGVGLPIALEAPSLARGDESATGGLTTTQKALRLGSRVGSGVLTAGMPIVPGMLAGMTSDVLTDKALSIKPPRAGL